MVLRIDAEEEIVLVLCLEGREHVVHVHDVDFLKAHEADVGEELDEVVEEGGLPGGAILGRERVGGAVVFFVVNFVEHVEGDEVEFAGACWRRRWGRTSGNSTTTTKSIDVG